MEPITNGIPNLEATINCWVVHNERGISHNLQAVFYAWLMLKDGADGAHGETGIDDTIRFALTNLRELVDKFKGLGEDIISLQENLEGS